MKYKNSMNNYIRKCLGCCGLLPVVTINEELYGKTKVVKISKIRCFN